MNSKMMNELWKRHLKLLSLIFTLNCLPKTSAIRVVHSEHTIPNKQVCGTQAWWHILHKLTTSSVSKNVSEKQFTSDILRITLATIDTMGKCKTLLTYKRSSSELENLGINIDLIKLDNQRVSDVADEWQNAMIAAEDIIPLCLKQPWFVHLEKLLELQ